MTSLRVDVEIAAPADRVWAVIRDVARWHEWTASITSVGLLDGAALAVGSRARVRQPKLPDAVWEVTALEEGRSFAWTTRGPGVVATGIHAVAPRGDGSLATLTVEHSGLLGPLFAWLSRGITERYVAMEAAGLKERCEGRR